MTAADNRVAVVVFLAVEDGADRLDRAHIAERAVKQAITTAGTSTGNGIVLPATFPGNHSTTATVHGVVELGAAMRNGYAWALPTATAYPPEVTE
ncbi:hypothetical protein SAMN05216215_108734 [Saccharopolyspora shandongensis]|uniref:Uncharacterized protein n=1 Tax=Saccharopolyspora shandongensis TaxID=418495 RepID=A0A1H3TMX9_9PSEU|nr:hypothetical protein [Saccharopolyspora shandongensis]SDZ51480.1 hypothetical protein SAMN05216215_108734 [Saccharopolyspora shandongensis]